MVKVENERKKGKYNEVNNEINKGIKKQKLGERKYE